MEADKVPPARAGSSPKSHRITITISHLVFEALVEESLTQGRSVSKLASFWLEKQAEVAGKRRRLDKFLGPGAWQSNNAS